METKSKIPTWLLPCLLTASLSLTGALVYHIFSLQDDQNRTAVSHYASAHDKALSGLVDAMSMIQLLYREVQDIKTRGSSCESMCH